MMHTQISLVSSALFPSNDCAKLINSQAQRSPHHQYDQRIEDDMNAHIVTLVTAHELDGVCDAACAIGPFQNTPTKARNKIIDIIRNAERSR